MTIRAWTNEIKSTGDIWINVSDEVIPQERINLVFDRKDEWLKSTKGSEFHIRTTQLK